MADPNVSSDTQSDKILQITLRPHLLRLERLAAIVDEGCAPNRTSSTRVALELKQIAKRLRGCFEGGERS